MVRQGDVLLIPMAKVSRKDLVRAGVEGTDTVLAHGEMTGHRHRLRAPTSELWAPKTGKVEHARALLAKIKGSLEDAPAELLVGVMRLEKSDVLVHEEHDSIEREAGAYQVRRQREYQPGALRIVAD